jgi:glycyl-radical enzyme activating protein
MASDAVRTAPVFAIQHFCLQDGPGIRSLVFFKGCPLRCAWCQNPESWQPQPQIGFKAHLCMGCGQCIQACTQGALAVPGHADPERCRGCFACVQSCPSGAHVRFGEPMSAADLLKALEPEFPLYQESGGGVTLSGGEPTMHAELCGELASLLRSWGVHTALSTCGFFSFPDSAPDSPLAGLLQVVDLILFDLKLWNAENHAVWCRGDNRGIKDNYRRLSEAYRRGAGPPVHPRLPLVPGITDTEENLKGWAGFLHETGCRRLTLVPYHHLGEAKRAWLNMAPGLDIAEISDAVQAGAADLLRRAGIDACAPGAEMWEAA